MPAVPKCEEMIANSGHRLFLQLEHKIHVIELGLRFERRDLAVSRKAERVVDIGIWVEFWITMDGVHREADQSAMRDMVPVPKANAFKGDDLEEQMLAAYLDHHRQGHKGGRVTYTTRDCCQHKR